jgi:16S rRNA processing protein RimM
VPAAAGERLVVALVRGFHGVNGGLRVEVLTDDPVARFAPGAHLYPEGAPDSLTISEAWAAAPGWIIRFHEIPSRNAAAPYLSVYLEADAGVVPALPRGSYYWHELLGCPVVDPEGGPLGAVRDVYRSGGAEILVVEGGPRGPFDLPVARPFVRILAPRRGEIVADADALDLPAVDQVRPPRPARAPRPRKGEQSPARPRPEAGGPAPEPAGAPGPVATPETGSESSPGTAPA